MVLVSLVSCKRYPIYWTYGLYRCCVLNLLHLLCIWIQVIFLQTLYKFIWWKVLLSTLICKIWSDFRILIFQNLLAKTVFLGLCLFLFIQHILHLIMKPFDYHYNFDTLVLIGNDDIILLVSWDSCDAHSEMSNLLKLTLNTRCSNYTVAGIIFIFYSFIRKKNQFFNLSF